MNLWVRSQDRRILQKVDNIYLNANYENKRICSFVDGDEMELATYKTKKRALEVLDEIQSLLMPKLILNSYDNITPEFSQNLTIMPISTDIKQFNSYVYQMPKE